MIAFTPISLSYIIPANAAAPPGVQIVPVDNVREQQYRVFNPDTTNTVWYAYGSTAQAAQQYAIIPVAGAPQNARGLPPNAVEIITAAPGAFFSGATVSTAVSLEVCSGYGI